VTDSLDALKFKSVYFYHYYFIPNHCKQTNTLGIPNYWRALD
jgi:hypothetical protein